MTQAVNPENRPPTPADLRAYCARYDVTARQVAELRGCTIQAVNAAMRADLTGRPISTRLCRELLDEINSVLLEREQETCLASR